MDYNKTGMSFYREGVIRGSYGHIQIKKDGYHNAESTSLKYLLTTEEIDTVQKTLENKEIRKHITDILLRINFAGLLLKEGDIDSTFIVGRAINPDDEVGAYPSLAYLYMKDGEFLSSDRRGEIVIGSGLASRLHINVEDVVYIYSVGNYGLPDIMESMITGIIEFGKKEVDDILVYANIDDIKELFGIAGIHEIVVFLDNTDNTDAICDYLSKKLDEKTYDIIPWHELATEYKQVAGFVDQQFIVTIFIIILVLVFLSTNTILMSVMERVNEFGTLRAIGRSRCELSLIIIFEGIVLGIFCVVAGIILSVVIVNILNALSIELPPPPGGTISYPLLIYLSFDSVVYILIIQLLTSLIATVYPVIKISGIKIVDALRYK
ncbi:MAG: ABC transporter permease [Spirochaetales bacterium]|nr:ABC transporter permease [Spirochaetales bacterium]